MTLIIADRVKESATVTGTNPLSLAGAMTGFQSFGSVCSTGSTCYYSIQAVDSNGNPTGNWETGLGTYTTSGNTLTRTAVTGSSNAGALVSFSAGTVQVFIDITAAYASVLASSAESLVPVSTSLHYGAIVKAIIYDTSKDSDGGAWRRRCQQTSWMNEPLCTGTWRGQRASLAAAWAVSGAAVGDFYQSTADGLFYTIGGTVGSPTQTQVYRGNVAQFPEQVAIIAEAGRVVVYDLTVPSCPMWMVFVGVANANMVRTGLSSIAAVNGQLWCGSNTNQALVLVNFVTDSGYYIYTSLTYSGPEVGTISQRNQGLAYVGFGTKYGQIVNASVNDIAAIVLPGAPFDPATGLPIPTIAVATAGGISVIQNTGVVVNGAYTLSCSSPSFNNGRLNYQYGGAEWGFRSLPVTSITSGFTGSGLNQASIPNVGATGSPLSAGKQIALAGATQVTLVRENPTAESLGMVAYLTNAYNSGWMVGDIRGCWLADTAVETITASGNLVTNPGPFTATTGWTAHNSTLSTASNELVLTGDGTLNSHQLFQAITTVVGKAYTLSATARRGTCSANIRVFCDATGTPFALNSSSATAVSGSVTFVASSTTTTITCDYNENTASLTAYFDSISCQLAQADRSVKNNGIIVNGSLTKAPVASGAGLVGYSGFSSANNLTQPYSANLDMTGDFCVMGWAMSNTVSGSTQTLLNCIGTNTFGIQIGRVTSGGTTYPLTPMVLLYGSSGTLSIQGSQAGLLPYSSGVWMHLAVIRAGNLISIYQNGSLVFSGTSILGSLATLNGALQIGSGFNITNYEMSMALWRIGATAASANQIGKIYKDELALFQPNAQCTLAGSSTAVTALAYDQNTDLLQVGTSWGVTAFNNLVQVSSTASIGGAVTSLSANQGAVLVGGATNGAFYQPAYLLRDELRRAEEARLALGRALVPVSATATAAQTTFPLPLGYQANFVYANGILKTLTTDYTLSFDGFVWSVVFNSGLVLNAPVTILANWS